MRAVWVVECMETGHESDHWVVRGYERKQDAERARGALTAHLAKLRERIERIKERDGDDTDWERINRIQAQGLPGDRHTSFDMERTYVVWVVAIVPAKKRGAK